jgi:hypothetical protein
MRSQYERMLSELLDMIELDGSISSDIEKLSRKKMELIEKKGKGIRFLDKYENIENIYKRIHPCSQTEDNLEELHLVTRVASRVAANRSKKKTPSPNKKTDIDKIFNEALEAEEALQVEVLEGNIKENVTTEADVYRASKGLVSNLKNQEACSLQTFEEVRREVEDIVHEYNQQVTKKQEAAERLQKSQQKIEEEQQRAEKLELNGRQISIFNILSEESDIDENRREKLSEKIDDIILDYSDTQDWYSNKSQRNQLVFSIVDTIKKNIDHEMDSKEIFEISEDVVENVASLY